VDQWQTKKLPTAVSWTVDLSLALYDDISHDCTQVSTARFTELEIEVKVIVQIFSSLEHNRSFGLLIVGLFGLF